MPSTVRLTPSRDSRLHLSALMLVAAFSLYVIATATVHAADSNTAACAADSSSIARPAAARDAARGDVPARDADQAPRQFKVPGEVLLCLDPAIKQEPLRELLDKYAPSAIEWSKLPNLADRSGPYQQRRTVIALGLQ